MGRKTKAAALLATGLLVMAGEAQSDTMTRTPAGRVRDGMVIVSATDTADDNVSARILSYGARIQLLNPRTVEPQQFPEPTDQPAALSTQTGPAPDVSTHLDLQALGDPLP